MHVTLEIDDTIAKSLAERDQDLARTVLEAIALEGYRAQTLSEEQVRILLGYETRMQVHDLLAQHNVHLQFDADDLAHEIASSDLLRSSAA